MARWIFLFNEKFSDIDDMQFKTQAIQILDRYQFNPPKIAFSSLLSFSRAKNINLLKIFDRQNKYKIIYAF